MTEYRTCFVLREVKVPMDDLKIGDIFRLGNASKDDFVDEYEYSVATKNAIALGDGNTKVECTGIALKPESPLKWGTNTMILSRLKSHLFEASASAKVCDSDACQCGVQDG